MNSVTNNYDPRLNNSLRHVFKMKKLHRERSPIIFQFIINNIYRREK